ncbi:MAG: AAA-like domain-containing protein [Anaerolineales bacterium]|nr:AAA-like domain-containing protein [Anaerolineales bacterium]
MYTTHYLNKLHQNLVNAFSQDELRTLCFQLGVEYDDLAGEGRIAKVRELIMNLQRRKQLDELITLCVGERPKILWRQALFLCYRRDSLQDNTLALYLGVELRTQGYDVFIDQSMRVGTKWLEEIDQKIKASDFLIVLLSKESSNSEMVQNELFRAHEYQRQQESPVTLPVRLNYEEMLPYSIAAFLNPRQYLLWYDESDNQKVLEGIVAAINGRLPHQDPTRFAPSQTQITVSEDGHAISDKASSHPPLPTFDPRLLARLRTPGGAVHLRDKFYVERQTDGQLRQELDKIDFEGVTITIRAPRQTGKTSLLIRGIRHARQERNAKTIFVDLQNMGSESLADLETFLYTLAQNICYELHQDEAVLDEAWEGALPPQQKLTFWLEDTVLPQVDDPVLLAIDEADALLQTSFYRDVFALLRSWHNRRAVSEDLDKLSIALVISTEPYLLIDDINQSPFNVGLALNLPDFNQAQVKALNRQHGDPVEVGEITAVMTLLNGHPYLTRKLLYHLVTNKLNWPELANDVARDNGIFGDHLRRLHWGLQKQPELQQALSQIIETGRCQDEKSLFRLSRAGIIKGGGDSFTFRCHLYRQYFAEKLR